MMVQFSKTVVYIIYSMEENMFILQQKTQQQRNAPRVDMQTIKIEKLENVEK